MGNQLDVERKTRERVNVILDRNLLVWLEKAAFQIREDTGATVNRSELIRAIVGAFADLNLKLRGCRTERDLREGLFKYLDRLIGSGAR
jgi:hypothetical protein